MSAKLDPDEVLFEIKDDTEYATLPADIFREAMRERDMLHAEREVWANVAQERNELRAENKRLRAEIHRERTEHEIEEKTLEAENERLRAAEVWVADAWIPKTREAELLAELDVLRSVAGAAQIAVRAQGQEYGKAMLALVDALLAYKARST